jgi:hypothetical protein
MTHTVTDARLEEIVRTALHNSNDSHMPAIKIVRCITGWGFVEAKAYVKEIWYAKSITVGDIKCHRGGNLKIIAIHCKWVWIETTNSEDEVSMPYTLTVKEWSTL